MTWHFCPRNKLFFLHPLILVRVDNFNYWWVLALFNNSTLERCNRNVTQRAKLKWNNWSTFPFLNKIDLATLKFAKKRQLKTRHQMGEKAKRTLWDMGQRHFQRIVLSSLVACHSTRSMIINFIILTTIEGNVTECALPGRPFFHRK